MEPKSSLSDLYDDRRALTPLKASVGSTLLRTTQSWRIVRCRIIRMNSCEVRRVQGTALANNISTPFVCMFNLNREMLGELVDNLGPVDTRATSPIHRSVPAFIQPQSQNAFSASPEADAKVLPLPFLEASLTFTEDFQDLAGQWAAIEKNYKEAEVYKNTFSTSVRHLEQERKACSLKYQQLQQVRTEIVARLQKQLAS
ncbi:unnamed protein product [Prunus armeniaca]